MPHRAFSKNATGNGLRVTVLLAKEEEENENGDVQELDPEVPSAPRICHR